MDPGRPLGSTGPTLDGDRRTRLLEAAASHCAEGILCLDHRGQLLYLNAAARRLLEGLLTFTEPILEELHRILARGPDERPVAFETPIMQALRGGVVEEESLVLRPPNRDELHLLVSARPLQAPGGEIEGVIAVLRDVTPQPEAELDRARLATRSRLLLESTDQGIYGIDLSGRCIFANPAACRLLGYELSEVLGQNMHELIHHTRRNGTPYPVEECPIFSAIRAGSVGWRVDDEVLWRKDGTSFPAEYSSIPIVEHGRTTGAVVTFQDITQRRLLEERRRELALEPVRLTAEKREATLRAVFASMQEVVLIMDSEGRFVSIPATNSPLLYRPSFELTGKTLQEVFPKEQAEVFLETIRRCLATDETQELEYTLRIGEKDTVFLGRGRRLGADRVLWVAYDLTERKRAEEERARLLARAEQARREAEDANRTKDLFFAMLTHELRTPLASILLRTEQLLRQSPDASPNRRAIEAIRQSAKNQAKLVDDLLDVARIAVDKMELRKEPVALASVVESVVEDMRPVAAKAGVRLELSTPALAARIEGDPQRLGQIVLNLIGNAIKFTAAGGEVSVRLDREGPWAVLQVHDTGIGIDPEELPKIFTRFYQVDPELISAKGSMGLGLSLVHDLVQLHGGTVEACSEGEAKGATFTVRLPLLQPPATRPDASSPAGP